MVKILPAWAFLTVGTFVKIFSSSTEQEMKCSLGPIYISRRKEDTLYIVNARRCNHNTCHTRVQQTEYAYLVRVCTWKIHSCISKNIWRCCLHENNFTLFLKRSFLPFLFSTQTSISRWRRFYPRFYPASFLEFGILRESILTDFSRKWKFQACPSGVSRVVYT